MFDFLYNNTDRYLSPLVIGNEMKCKKNLKYKIVKYLKYFFLAHSFPNYK